VRVPRSHEEAGHAVVDDVRDAADVRRHDRSACRERFDDRHRRALARRGEHDGIADRVPRGDVLLVTEEQARPGDAEVVGSLLESDAVVTVAHEEQQRVDPPLAKAREGREQVVGSLHRGHPPEPSDDEQVLRDPEAAPHFLYVPFEGDAGLELDAQPDDGELLARGDAEGDQLVSDLRAHGDETVGGAGEDGFDGAEEQRSGMPEVPAEHVAVERMDDDRPASQAREHRRRPSHRAGLGRVGVDDIGPELPDDAREPPCGGGVMDRRELA
jgi:hypothetical protein